MVLGMAHTVRLLQVSTSSRLTISGMVTPALSGVTYNMTWSLTSGSLAATVGVMYTAIFTIIIATTRTKDFIVSGECISALQSLEVATSTGLSVTSTAAIYRLPLVFKADALLQKTSYTLRLTATQNGVTGE